MRANEPEHPAWTARHQLVNGLWPSPSVHPACGRGLPGRCGDIVPQDKALSAEEVRTIETLLHELAGETYLGREKAMRCLASLDDRAGRHLQRRLANIDDPEVFWRAREALRSIADAPADNRSITVTAAALLMYIGAGYTHLSKDTFHGVCYGEIVKRGLEALMRFRPRLDQPDCCLALILSAIALCEAYGMTSAKFLVDPAAGALQAMAKVQAKDGGWPRHEEGTASDPLATYFAMAAIKSAEIAEFETPKDAVLKLSSWVETRQDCLIERDTLTVAVVAVHRRLMQRRRDSRQATDELLRRAKSNSERWGAVEWYVTSCATFLCDGPGGPTWKAFVQRLNEVRVAGQLKEKTICSYGAWRPISDLDKHFGTAWTTAVTILSFEYYALYPTGIRWNQSP